MHVIVWDVLDASGLLSPIKALCAQTLVRMNTEIIVFKQLAAQLCNAFSER